MVGVQVLAGVSEQGAEVALRRLYVVEEELLYEDWPFAFLHEASAAFRDKYLHSIVVLMCEEVRNCQLLQKNA